MPRERKQRSGQCPCSWESTELWEGPPFCGEVCFKMETIQARTQAYSEDSQSLKKKSNYKSKRIGKRGVSRDHFFVSVMMRFDKV